MPIGPAVFGKISEKTHIVRFIDAKTKLAINNTSSLHCRYAIFGLSGLLRHTIRSIK